ncbi:unnamed protein product, partial [Allacma fusca]
LTKKSPTVFCPHQESKYYSFKKLEVPGPD